MSISQQIKEITQQQPEVYDLDTICKIFNCIDYTSLGTADNEASIERLVNQVNSFQNSYKKNVAAICVFPNFIETVKTHLKDSRVKIASVGASFPFSQTFAKTQISEIEEIVKAGADEIDIVMPIGLLLNQKEKLLLERLKLIKHACQSKHLKIILETDLLNDSALIKSASELAIEAGANFIKTSTGKNNSMASLDAVYIMSKVIASHHKTTGKTIGIKPAGGIITLNNAFQYWNIVKEILGEKWNNNTLFRIGASRLIDDVISRFNN